MNKPTQPEDPPTHGGTSPADTAGGTAEHGIPKGMDQHDATGTPTSDRQQTETTPVRGD